MNKNQTMRNQLTQRFGDIWCACLDRDDGAPLRPYRHLHYGSESVWFWRRGEFAPNKIEDRYVVSTGPLFPPKGLVYDGPSLDDAMDIFERFLHIMDINIDVSLIDQAQRGGGKKKPRASSDTLYRKEKIYI